MPNPEPQDEGYDETIETSPQPVSHPKTHLPDFASWPEADRAEYAFQLLSSCSQRTLAKTVRRLGPWLLIDFLSSLPSEIALHILSFTDIPTLHAVALVSRKWNRLASSQDVWRDLFLRQGYLYDTDRVREHLSRPKLPAKEAILEEEPIVIDDTTPVDSLSHPPPSPHDFHPLILPGQHLLQPADPLPSLASPDALHKPISLLHWDSHNHPRILWSDILRNKARLEAAWAAPTPPAPRKIASHPESVYCLQFQGDRLLTGARDRAIKIWDIPSGQCLRTLTAHSGSVLSLQFDDADIYSGGSEGTIAHWDLASGRLRRLLRGHEDSVLGVRFDRHHLISCSKDRTIRVWKRPTPDDDLDDPSVSEPLTTLQGHRVAVNVVRLAHGAIASGSGDRTIRLWDLERGECTRVMEGHRRGIACLEFDGRTIITGASDMRVKVWDARSGACVRTLEGHSDLVRTVAWDGAGRIVSGGYDKTVKVWDLRSTSQEPHFTLTGHQGRVFKLQFDSSRIISCSQDMDILEWDFSSPFTRTDFLL